MTDAPDAYPDPTGPDLAAATRNTVLGTWFERDRAHVCLSWMDADGEAGPTIVEWWDASVQEALTDGFLKASDYHGSAVAYAASHGMLELGAAPVSIAPAKFGLVASHPDKGLYLGWLPGGAPCWSSEATQDRLDKGAYVFDSPESVDELFLSDAARMRSEMDGATDATVEVALAEAGLDQGHETHEVDLGVPALSNATVSYVSIDACLGAGVTLPGPASPSIH